MKLLVHGCLGILCLPVLVAEPAAEARIAANGSLVEAGRPKPLPELHAITGKPLTLRWAAPAGAGTTLATVDRITAERRVPDDQGEAAVINGEWQWQWTPPATRGVVTYELKLEALPKKVLLIHVHEAAWLEKMAGELAGMQWQAAGLKPAELDALAAIGLGRIDDATDAPSGAVMLRVIPDAASPRREVVWGKDPDMVVWTPGAAAGDERVLAPRWWISKDALATDHGLIRFYDLFSAAPIVLRQP